MATVAIIQEERGLEQLEAVIERGLSTFIEVGNALREIRDSRLYKKNYSSFEEYCRVRWCWTRSNADKYIQAASFVEQSEENSPQISSVNQALTEARSSKMDVHYSSETPEWTTPPEIIERTQKALGSIDLDPCSPPVPSVPAVHTFTKEANGLNFDWCGNVYMNPPYGREIGAWVEKLVSEYKSGRTKEAIALVPARVDTDWFRMFRDCAICFIDGRLKFSGHDNSAPFPSAVVYLGTDIAKFAASFDDVGDVWIRWAR